MDTTLEHTPNRRVPKCLQPRGAAVGNVVRGHKAPAPTPIGDPPTSTTGVRRRRTELRTTSSVQCCDDDGELALGGGNSFEARRPIDRMHGSMDRASEASPRRDVSINQQGEHPKKVKPFQSRQIAAASLLPAAALRRARSPERNKFASGADPKRALWLRT